MARLGMRRARGVEPQADVTDEPWGSAPLHPDSTGILPWLFRRAPLGGMIATEVAPAPISGRVESDRHHV
jgi:hypothetical protein